MEENSNKIRQFKPVKETKSKKPLVILLFSLVAIGVLALAGWKWYGQIAEKNQNLNDADKQISKLEKEIESLRSEQKSNSEQDSKVAGNTFDERYYTLQIPAGFEQVSEVQLKQRGPGENNRSFLNKETGQYFEIDVNPPGSGINVDLAWSYAYKDSKIILTEKNTTICKEGDPFCSAGDNRLDGFIKGSPDNLEIKGNNYYFTFGNTKSESIGDLSFVDDFIAGISVK